MKEYVDKNKSDYENFLDPQVLEKYIGLNRECSVYVSKMKKHLWKPDKLKVGKL